MSENNIKIGIVGLQNAGKTSLIRTLQKSYHIGEDLAPTKFVERTVFGLFGIEGTIWDFGGQKKYREAYIAKPEKHFTDLRYLFFVIDIQDENSHDEALKYLEQVYKHAHELSPGLMVSVIFHKFDPQFSNNDEYLERIENLSRKIHKIINDNDVFFANTTIYNPISILTTFSQIILGDTHLYNILSTRFANFALQFGIEYVSLTINSLFELGNFRIKNEKEDFISASVSFYEQFQTIEFQEMDNEVQRSSFDFEGYRFELIQRKIQNYTALLTLAYPLDTISEINSEEIEILFKDIEQQFIENPPKLG